jgi:hypothetical protein
LGPNFYIPLLGGTKNNYFHVQNHTFRRNPAGVKSEQVETGAAARGHGDQSILVPPASQLAQIFAD